jgi:hypothetical protein
MRRDVIEEFLTGVGKSSRALSLEVRDVIWTTENVSDGQKAF